MKVLILGHTGMLGNCVDKYLSSFKNIETFNVDGRWPNDNFLTEIVNMDVDYVVNCIGAIPQRTKDFEINYELPIWLDKNLECRVIHPGTDCEMDDDHYGISKVNASDYIKNDGKVTKIIKTSIIGHELNNSNSLLDWFLSSEESVFGYTECYWNGNTTLEWAKQAYKMINNWEKYARSTVISTDCVSKYELLNIIKEVYNKDIIINKNDDMKINKCLNGHIKLSPINEQLEELKKFYNK
tara:strand:- start:264 stop:983 length:720 start_codon:yes stop_codon:yes gene_type:complete